MYIYIYIYLSIYLYAVWLYLRVRVCERVHVCVKFSCILLQQVLFPCVSGGPLSACRWAVIYCNLFLTLQLSKLPKKGSRRASVSSSQEWSSSTSQSPLLVHHAGKGGHVSQFFQEWQFEMQGQGVVPRERDHFSYDDYCDWGAIDPGTNTVVLIARVFDWRNNKICEASKLSKFPANGLANFLGLSLLWGGIVKNAGRFWWIKQHPKEFVDVCQLD